MVYSLYSAAAGLSVLGDKDIRARVIAFWSAIFGYAKIRQAAMLQSYMKADLSDLEIEEQVIRAAIGPDVIAG
jgi:hypothetical protein